MKEQLIRYKPGRDPKPESRTDWDRLKRMSDEEVDQAARNDPDAQPLSDEQLARGFRPNALTALRKRLSLSQTEFAKQFRLNLRTLQDWEQGRRKPEDIARVYLRVIERNPDAVSAALKDPHPTPGTPALAGGRPGLPRRRRRKERGQAGRRAKGSLSPPRG